MTRSIAARVLASVAALTLAAAVSAQGLQQPWPVLSAAADSALRSEDYARYYRLVVQLHSMAPSHPRITWALARAHALRGERDSAFHWLDRYAAMGLTRDLPGDSSLASLRGDPRFAAVAARLERNARPFRSSETAFVLSEPDLVVEDIAFDGARKRFFLSSIRKGKIVVGEPDGRWRDFVAAALTGVGRSWRSRQTEPRADSGPPARHLPSPSTRTGPTRTALPC